jgi:hypothetical protein
MRNPTVENNGVANLSSRLEKRRKLDRKMKVYPRMLMKTKGLRIWEDAEARMLMKTKPVISLNPECY